MPSLRSWRLGVRLSALTLGVGLFIALSEAWAAPVSESDARQFAANWLSQARDRLGHTLPATIQSAQRFTNTSGQCLGYIVVLDPAGFVFTAPDDRIEPIIAFSAFGHFDPNPNNPLLALLSSDLDQRLSEAEAVADPAAVRRASDSDERLARAAELAAANQAKWRQYTADSGGLKRQGIASVSEMHVAPLIQSRWNQKTAQGLSCYNYYCPPGPDGSANNYYAGCVATAMAQLMRHWQRPASAYGHSYVYTNMPLNPQTVSPLTATHRQAIGRLCRDAGASVNMSYGSGGSSADMLIVDSALTGTFGYSNARDLYRSSGIDATTRQLVLRSNLAAGLPVLMGVRRTGSGHAVIVDGFGYTSGTLYYHVNMGWGGTDDAWYNLPTIDAYYTYTAVDAFVYNIYTNGAGEIIAGRVRSTSGAAISGVVVTATGGYSSSTDSNGYYGVRVPSAATYSLAAVKAGFQSGSLAGIAVGTSSTSPLGNCGNYFGADFTLSSFSFRATGLTNNVLLRWSRPTECGLSNDTVMVRSRTDQYPVNIADGEQVYLGTNQIVEHKDLTSGQPYYYTIWVSQDGVTFIDPP